MKLIIKRKVIRVLDDISLLIEKCGGPGSGVPGPCPSGSGKIKDKTGKEWAVSHSSRVDAQGNKRHKYDVLGDDGKQVIAYAELDRKAKSVMSVHVDREHRRKGIASALYTHIEKHLGYKLQENWATTEEGSALWNGRRRDG